MDTSKIIEALQQVDEVDREKVVGVGSFMVWSFRGTTKHPLLSDALATPETGPRAGGRGGVAGGEFILVTSRALLPGQSVEIEADACRIPHAEPNQNKGERGAPRYSYICLEDRLHTVEISAARRLLSDLQKTRTHLSLPVIVAVGPVGAAGHRFKYLGLRTNPNDSTDLSIDSENLNPNRGQLPGEDEKGFGMVFETLSVRRPGLPLGNHEEVRIGDLLRRSRGFSPETKVELSCRYDLPIGDLTTSTSSSSTSSGSASLDLVGGTTLERACEAPLAQVVPALLATGAATLNLRCGQDPRGAQKGRLPHEAMSLKALDRLVGGEVDHEEGIISSEADAAAAADEFLEEELGRNGPNASRDEDKHRPSRDFLDKLWLRLLRRCATIEVLVAALSSLLAKMGTADGVVPFIRRTNSLEAATLFRIALKVSAAQRYAGNEWEVAVKEWKERCWYYSKPEHALRLTLTMGLDLLRRDALHIITQQGSVTVADLGSLMMEEEEVNLEHVGPSSTFLPPAPANSASLLPDAVRTRFEGARTRLLRLLQVAELADLAGRQFFDLETHRRLVLQAIDFQRSRSECHPRNGGAFGYFSVPLTRAAAERVLLSALGSTSTPVRVRVRSGKDMIQGDRITSLLDDTGGEGSPGVWSVSVPDEENEEDSVGREAPGGGRRLHFHLTVVESFRVL